MARRIVTPPRLEGAAEAAVRRVATRELARRRKLPEAIEALEATLFPAQRALALSGARRVVTWSGRRSGKTYALVVRALRAASAHPGSWIPIIERTTTCQSAQLVWRELQAVNEAFGLGFKFHHTLLIATAPNRSRIQVVGAETIEAADKLRGEHPPEALVDEAGTFRPHVLEYLLREVLEPALLDYRGTLVLSGTPSPRRVGPFAEACGVLPSSVADAWERHHWTFLDNEALPLDMPDAASDERRAARAAEFTSLKARYGWTDASPWVQREYLGQWAEDESSLVYRLAALNHRDPGGAPLACPPLDGEWRYGLGLDFGYDDDTAFVVVGWRRGDPTLWVLESYQQARLIPSAVAAHVERLRARYRFSFIVGDTGGYGKGPAEEMRQRYGIPIESAQKRGKEVHVAFVNGDLVSGVIRIVEGGNRDLIADLYGLRLAPTPDGAWAEDERDANHLPDAFLYAVMHQRASVVGMGVKDTPEPYSLEWWAARERAWLASAVERAELEAQGGGDGDPVSEAVGLLPGD